MKARLRFVAGQQWYLEDGAAAAWIRAVFVAAASALKASTQALPHLQQLAGHISLSPQL
jgi:hypothetical protein